MLFFHTGFRRNFVAVYVARVRIRAGEVTIGETGQVPEKARHRRGACPRPIAADRIIW